MKSAASLSIPVILYCTVLAGCSSPVDDPRANKAPVATAESTVNESPTNVSTPEGTSTPTSEQSETSPAPETPDGTSWTTPDVVAATCSIGALQEYQGYEMLSLADPVSYCEVPIDGTGKILYGVYGNFTDMNSDCELVQFVAPTYVHCIVAAFPDTQDLFLMVVGYEPDPALTNDPVSDLEPLIPMGFQLLA